MQEQTRRPGMRLSGVDRKRLVAALKAAREARVYRRVEALLLIAEGQTVAEAAHLCHVDRSSVHRWLKQYGCAAGCDRARGWDPSWPATAERLAYTTAACDGASP